MAKVKKEPLSGTQMLKLVSTSVGVKPKVLKTMLTSIADIVAHQLNTVGEVKLPYICKFVKKVKPARKVPAGIYPNFFKKDADGKPTMEQKPARVIPEKVKIKFSLLKNVKDKLSK